MWADVKKAFLKANASWVILFYNLIVSAFNNNYSGGRYCSFFSVLLRMSCRYRTCWFVPLTEDLLRFRASTHYRPELVPEERAVRLTEMLNRVADKECRPFSFLNVALSSFRIFFSFEVLFLRISLFIIPFFKSFFSDPFNESTKILLVLSPFGLSGNCTPTVYEGHSHVGRYAVLWIYDVWVRSRSYLQFRCGFENGSRSGSPVLILLFSIQKLNLYPYLRYRICVRIDTI